MTPFPGIPEEALETLAEPDPPAAEALREALAPLADPPDGPLMGLIEYGRLVLAANRVTNLTGARDWESLIRSHLIDCVHAAGFVPAEARRILDWGSGAGFPGLVWALLFPEKQILLGERAGKKAAFLEEAVARLGLFNVDVLHGQAEERLAEHRQKPELVVARAVEPLARLLPRLQRNKVRLGSLFLMAGPRWSEDWEQLPEEIRGSWKLKSRHSYALGAELGQRSVVVLKPQ